MQYSHHYVTLKKERCCLFDYTFNPGPVFEILSC